MTKGNQIADLVKSQAHLFPFAIDIIIGIDEQTAIRENPEPRDPPDLAPDNRSFCGIPLLGWSAVPSRLELVLDLHKLPRAAGIWAAKS